MLILLPLLLPTAQAQTQEGELSPPIERAAALHLTEVGLDHAAEALAKLLPPTIVEDGLTGEFYCDEDDRKPITYTVNNLVISLNVTQAELNPSDGRLDLYLTIEATASSDELLATGRCTFLTLDEVCNLELSEPITLAAHIGLQMALVDGAVDVTAEPPVIELSTIPNPLVESEECGIYDIIEWQIENNPEFLNELIWELLEPTLADLGSSLEEPLEEGLGALNINTSFALGDASLDLALYPTELVIDAGGLFLGLGAEILPSALSECVPVTEGPALTEAPWPTLGADPWDGGAPHDAALVLSRDFTDSLLWAVWAAGGLCLEVSDLAGAPLTTSLLGSLFGESFEALYEDDDEDHPASLVVGAEYPPTSRFDATMPLYIDLEALRIDPYGELDHRFARFCQVNVDGWIGVSVPFEGSNIAPTVVVDEEALVFSEAWTELLAPGYSEGIAGFLPTVIGSLLPADLLPTVSIPTYRGIGVDEATWVPTDDGLWLGAFVVLDTQNVEPLEIDGCGALGCGGEGGGDPLGCDEGCGDTGAGCEDSGCTTHGRLRVPGGRIFLGVALAALVLRRRRA